ncbi:MAG: transcription termination factor Rho [Clostridiales bacterium]|nr:transcription termination factor Rho [Clostridiales bacterium]
MKQNFESMPLQALRELAKAKGIKGVSTLRKQELIDTLNAAGLSANAQKTKETAEKEMIVKETLVKESAVEEKTSPIKEKRTSSSNLRSQTTDRNKNASLMKAFGQTTPQTYPNPRAENERINSSKVSHRENSGLRSDNVRVENSKNDHTRSDNREENNRAEATRSEVIRQENTRNESTRSDIASIPSEYEQYDSGETKKGILEVLSEGYGFIRCDNFLPGENDVYVSPAQIRRFNLKTGDILVGNTRVKSQNEKFSALLYVKTINGLHPAEATKRKRFEELTPIYPNQRIHLETPGCGPAMRMVDLISPIGKGQRGMIVSQPKAGKTTLLKQVAKAITTNHPEMHLIILLIDERPEEVTDMKESIQGENVEVIYSTFDELPDNHKRVSEMVIERAKRLVEHKQDVVILLDSITRLARAYNLTCQSSGRTLSGGLDPAALHMPKKFFGAARNMREGGSLTILATALVETGSRMDDVVFEEFKGTGNMELVLDRSLSEKRIFPAIDLPKSSTRRDDLLLTQSEAEANYLMRKALNGLKSDEAVERIVQMFVGTKSNKEFVEMIKKTKL